MHDDLFDDMPPELLATLDRVRARYGEVQPPAAGPALSAFLSVGLTNDNGDLPATAASNANEPVHAQVVGLPNWRTTLTQRRRQAMRTVAAFIGTTLGKVVLGTTVAAASVGAGQAAGVIDMNGDPAPADQIVVDDEAPEAPEVEAPEAPEVEAPEAPEVEAPEVEADDQGEDADEQGEVEADDDQADEVEVDDDQADEIEADDDQADEVEADDAEVDESDDDAVEVGGDTTELDESESD